MNILETTFKNGYTELSLGNPIVGRIKYCDSSEYGAYIKNIYINQEHQNKGYGAILLDEVIKRCSKCEGISLFVAYNNEGAMRFYRQHDFFIAMTKYNHRGTKHYLMVRKL